MVTAARHRYHLDGHELSAEEWSLDELQVLPLCDDCRLDTDPR